MRNACLANLVAVVLTLTPSIAKSEDVLSPAAQRGLVIVRTNCARCHAIGSTGESPHREAPPFRTLGQKYPIDWLAEALGEGLSTGHPDMPEFVFEANEVRAILDYLQSIQER